MSSRIPSAAALLLAMLLAPAIEAADGAQPNVILIMADDLGYGDLSCYGSTMIRTPVLDQLAADGVRLTSFYTGATVCTPSRMALLTGMYPTRLGWSGGVLGYKMKTSTGLAPEALTIAEVFKNAGYRTAISGKWHLGSTPELHPLRQGFDRAFHIKMSNNQTKKLWRDEELVADPFDNRLLTEQFTREAISFIRENRDHPFFLYLPFTAPHFPAQAHPDWKGKSPLGAYGDVVEEMDARIGEILETLADTGLDERTIVIFHSDNGPEPGQKKWASAAPYRGLKWSSLEGGTRVPCLIRWPGVIEAGQECDDLTAAIDLLPTLARACDIEIQMEDGSPPFDGVNVWESLSGTTAQKPHPRNDLLFWSGWAIPQAIRVGRWKLVFDDVEGVPGSEAGPALFDLATDPAEKTNLSTEHPDRVTEMMALARKRLADIAGNALPLGGTPSEKPRSITPRWLK